MDLTQNLPIIVLSNSNRIYAGISLKLTHSSGVFTLNGFIMDSFLGSKSSWSKKKGPAKTATIAEVAQKHETPMRMLAIKAKEAAMTYLDFLTEEGAGSATLQRIKDLWRTGVNLENFPRQLEQSTSDKRLAQERLRLADQIAASIRLEQYPQMFAASRRNRKFIAVLGPTNSGKTYDAFKRLQSAASGVYLGPLRLLALEAYNRLNAEFNVPTSLITGEERRITDNALVVASTVEMLSPDRATEVAIIDEIQMLIDPSRGWSWTQAVVGANADEVWMLGALSAEPAIRALAARLGVPLEVRYTERKNPLAVAPVALAKEPYAGLAAVQPGDALIVFSRKDALNLRDDLLARGKKVACIYGALSPEVREREAARFAGGEADVIVATDAIGLGLNLPIQRVIFTSISKFNGETRELLSVPLLQQIAGRAGRYGHGGEAGVAVGLTDAEHAHIKEGMAQKQLPLPSRGFRIAPGHAYLEQLSNMTGEDQLAVLLTLFQAHADRGDGFFSPYVDEELLNRAQVLDRTSLPLDVKHILAMAPIETEEDLLTSQWFEWVKKVEQGIPITIDFAQVERHLCQLIDAENIVRLLTGYLWLSHRLYDEFPLQAEAAELLWPWESVVDEHLRSARKQGDGSGRRGRPSWYKPQPIN